MRVRKNNQVGNGANLGFEEKLWGAEAVEDDGQPFEEKMKRLTATLRQQQREAAGIDATIAGNLKELGYGA